MSPGAALVAALTEVADALERGDTVAAERANEAVEAGRAARVRLTEAEHAAATAAWRRAAVAAQQRRDELGPELAKVAAARRTQNAYDRSG